MEDSVHRALERAPHLTVYRRGELPKRYRLEGPRIAPIVAVADEGWTISRRTAEDPSPTIIRGNLRVPAFRNVYLQPLMADVLGIQPGESDGSLDTLRAVLSVP
jgi:Type I phosphodiesterase / nucleotide pyrophosphatase